MSLELTWFPSPTLTCRKGPSSGGSIFHSFPKIVVQSQDSLHENWFDRMLAKGRDRYSLLYRRSLSETGIDFASCSEPLWTKTGVIAKTHSTLNITCPNRLWRRVTFIGEPPRLLSLRSLVGRFFPCNCYSRKGRKIAHARHVLEHTSGSSIKKIGKNPHAALVSDARPPRLRPRRRVFGSNRESTRLTP